MTPDKVAVLGAGSWGMAIARLLNLKGLAVCLWEFDERAFLKLKSRRGDPDKLKGFTLADEIVVTNDLLRAVAGCPLIVLAVPSQSVRSVLVQLNGRLMPQARVVNLAKGIETRTLKRMSQVITEEMEDARDHVVTLSGPSHAEEVVMDIPTAVVVAGSNDDVTSQMQAVFSSRSFRVYKSRDLVGVELGGSLKNIIAIAAGIADGLGFGDNTKGAIITRGLAEITRLGTKMGASAETFAGLSGIGDLVTTCTSRHSRNRHVGHKVGEGQPLHQVLTEMHMVAEGVETTRSGHQLAREHGVDMPITHEVFSVLFEQKNPSLAVEELMGRELKAEIWR